MKAMKYISTLCAIIIGMSILTVTGLAEGADFITRIDSYADYLHISQATAGDSQVARQTAYIVPTPDVNGAPDYTVFQNVNIYTFHWDFLAEATDPETGNPFRPALASLLEDLRIEEYCRLVLWRDNPAREYFDGRLYEIHDGSNIFFGFSVLTAGEPAELPEQGEIEYVYNELRVRIDLAMELKYAPFEAAYIEKARTYVDPPFPIYFFPEDDLLAYEGYSLNTNYGRVRLFTKSELIDALAQGTLGWQDIVVVDEVDSSLDIGIVVAGVITGSRQAPGSHINVRTMARGTPNAYVADPLTTLAPYRNQLVRLEVRADGYTIEPATEENAEAWWASHRPQIEVPDPDDTYSQILRCNDPSFNVDECTVSRFGGKGSNLAHLYQVIDRQYQSEAIFIPVHYYNEFINHGHISLQAGNPYYERFQYIYNSSIPMPTYKEFIDTFLNDEAFKTDMAFRKDVLEFLREKIDNNEWGVDYTLVNEVKEALRVEFGIDFPNVYPSDYVRFRSSSNLEDSLEFSGAGLYDSKGKFDTAGDRKNPEKAIREGLVGVWASLWTLRAVEERMYHQIDQSKARMGILITRGYSSKVGNKELARGVAFTFDPYYSGEGYAYQINVQFGDTEVALPEPGTYPEIDRIIIRDGAITGIERIRRSSLSDAPAEILSDAQLEELGNLMLEVEREYEFDLQGWSREQVAFDLEFKIRPDNTLLIKQIRPFLKPAPTSGIYVPGHATAESIFKKDRGLDAEHCLKAKIHFRSGNMDLPKGPPFIADLIEKIEIIENIYPPTARDVFPTGSGEFAMSVENVEGTNYYNYTYRQLFIDGVKEFWVIVDNISISDNSINQSVTFNEDGLYDMTIIDTEGRVYSPSNSSKLEEKAIDVTLDNGIRFVIYERQQGGFYIGTVPAHIERAQVFNSDGTELRDVSKYWNLIYSAGLHNTHPIYRFYFDTLRISDEDIIGIEYEKETGVTQGITSDGRFISFGTGAANMPPYFTISDMYIKIPRGQMINLVLTAEDPESDTIHFSGFNIPEDAVLSENGNGTATFTWTPQEYGQFEITFTVHDGYHASVVTDRLYLMITADPLPVVADFMVSPSTGAVPLTVQFTDNSGDAISWQWSFGDGSEYSYDQNPIHTYEAVGTYSVSLFVHGPASADFTIKQDCVTVSEAGEIYSAYADKSIVMPGDLLNLSGRISFGYFNNYGWLCDHDEFINGPVLTTRFRQDSTLISDDFNVDAYPSYLTIGEEHTIQLRASKIIDATTRIDRYSEPFTVIVAKNGKDIQEDIDDASQGDTVPIEPGIYKLTDNLIIDKKITLKAEDPNPDNTILILDEWHIIVRPYKPFGNVTIEGITVQALLTVNVTIEGITVKDHIYKEDTQTGYGQSGYGVFSIQLENGPIQNYWANLTLKNCKIIDNKGIKASAIYNSSNSILNLENTLIAQNRNIPSSDIYKYGYSPLREYLYGRVYCGTIYMDEASNLNVYNSTIADNINDSMPITIPGQTGYGQTGYGERQINIIYGAIQRSQRNIVNMEDSIMWNNGKDNNYLDFSYILPLEQRRYIINSDIQNLGIVDIVTRWDSLIAVIKEDPLFEPEDIDYLPHNQICIDRGMGARFE